jgi:nucleoside-diphosphate-sugar epimerase
MYVLLWLSLLVTTAAAAHHRHVKVPSPVIVGYASWNECDKKIIHAVEQGVNVVMWFAINLALNSSTGLPAITGGPDMDCVAYVVRSIDELGLDTLHIVSTKNKGFKENYLKFSKKINYKNNYKKSYGKFKLMSEKLFQKLATSGIDVSIARCFTFVGESLPLNSNFVIGNLIQSVLKKKKITIKANYQIYRSYMYSDDLVRFLLKIVENSNTHCPIYNVGSSNKVSINKIAKYFAKKYNLVINAPQILNNKNDLYLPNIDRVTSDFKIKYKYSSMQAINKTIKILIKNK